MIETHKNIRKKISVFGLNGLNIIILLGIIIFSVVMVVVFFHPIIMGIFAFLIILSYFLLSYLNFRSENTQKRNSLPKVIFNQPKSIKYE